MRCGFTTSKPATGAWSHVVKLTNIYENYTSAVAFSPDGKILAVCATDNRIYLMNPSTGEEIARLTGHHWYPWALAFTSNSKMLYSSGWDAVHSSMGCRGSKAARVAGRRAARRAWSPRHPTGKRWLTRFDSGAIRLVDAESGKEGRTLALPGTRYSQLTFSPDGRRLAGGGTCGNQVHVAVWDVASGKLAPPLGLADRTRPAFDGRVTLLRAGRAVDWPPRCSGSRRPTFGT